MNAMHYAFRTVGCVTWVDSAGVGWAGKAVVMQQGLEGAAR